jgi:putative DNA primase/helicase
MGPKDEAHAHEITRRTDNGRIETRETTAAGTSTKVTTPQARAMTEFKPGSIPDELKAREQWLLWDESNDTPRRPHWKGDFRISWSDPADWHSFDEAVEQASIVDSWGIGYVMALDNDKYPDGRYGCLDLDGCLNEDGQFKDWVPDLRRFGRDGAYAELSPSGTGLHIPLVNQPEPEWWTDSHISDEEHEGVEYLTHKFCTFTGQAKQIGEGAISGIADTNPAPFLYESYETLNGESPRLGSEDTRGHARDNDEWDKSDIEKMLGHVSSSCSYPEWRNILFALHDWDDGTTGKSLAESWSRGGGWDDESQRLIDAIWTGAEPGDGITLGTLVYHAQQAGWKPPGRRQQKQPVSEQEKSDARQQTNIQARVQQFLSWYQDEDTDFGRPEAVHEIAVAFTDSWDFLHPPERARGWRKCLHVYNEDTGVYEPRGERFVAERVEQMAQAFVANQTVNEVVGKVRRLSGVEESAELETQPNRLVVTNGILDLHTGDLHDLTPNEYHQTRLPVAYDPEASTTAIDEFFHDIVADRDVDTLYRLVAHTLYKEYASEKAAMLLGDGRNGKSVFLSLVEQFLGEHNVAERSLQELGDKQFAANNLQNKLANIQSDMSDEAVQDLGTFKKLTGRDTMVADVKYETPVVFENYATLMFAANRMPAMEEDTHAVWRRWVYINFPNTFEPDSDDHVPKRELMARLTTEQELQGLLARSVKEIREWHKGREWFVDALSPQQVREKMKRASEPIFDFAHSCLRPADGESVPKADVREAYRRYAREEGLPTQEDNVFGEQLMNIRDFDIESGQHRDGARRLNVYKNIQLSARGRQVLGLDDPDEEHQSQMGSTRERADALIRLCREIADGQPVHKERLIGRCLAEMTADQADAALKRAKDQGDVMVDGEQIVPV